jgi:hypothetical protein
MWRLSFTDQASDDLVKIAVYIANQSSSRDLQSSLPRASVQNASI